jgi:hypothetical protein
VKLEQLIAKHRPPESEEEEPAGPGILFHLNRHKLLVKAMRCQLEKDGTVPAEALYSPLRPGKADRPACVITRLTAWEVLSDAQRHGLRVVPLQAPVPVDAEHDHGAFLPPAA